MTTTGSAVVGFAATVTVIATVLWLANSGGSDKADWQPGWQFTAPLNLPRRAHAAVATDSHVYAIGGIDQNDNYVANVEYAPVLADGSLGPWHPTSPLNVRRFYLDAVIVGDYVYAIGGANGARGDDNTPVAVVEKARIRADGTLGTWSIENYLTTPRRGLKAIRYRQHLYALGGYNGQFLRTVERTHVTKQGRLADWQEVAQHAVVKRYIHSAAINNTTMYLLAGHVEGEQRLGYGDVESTTIQPDGSIAEWRLAPWRLKTPRFIAGAVSLNNFLYVIGGHDGGQRLDSVEFTYALNEDRPQTWRTASHLNTARSGPAVTQSRGTLYVIGGAGATGTLGSVEYARPALDGQPGLPNPAVSKTHTKNP
jgi:hypothetical protein